MNGKDIFLGLKYIGDDLIEKAEYGEFPTKAEKIEKKVNTRKLIRRPFLVAAIIAMMLLLVGCAIVYVLSMKEIKLGEQEVTYDVYDYDPQSGEAVAYVGQDTMTQQVLTLAGLSNTPAAKAAREWYEFTEAYDPDRSIQGDVWGREPVFPAEYYGYILYTQEMKDKLDEILDKYDLKPMGKKIEFQSDKMMLKALGVENILNPGSDAVVDMMVTSFYENGSLNLHFLYDLPGEEEEDIHTQGWLYYRNKGCLIPDTAILTEAEWEEWNYTTASGDQVLIVSSEEASSAWFFNDLPNHTVSLQIRTIIDVYEEEENGVPVAKFHKMERQQLERIADTFDFSLEPKLIDGWEELDDGAVTAGQEINGYTIEPVSAFSDGYGYQIILKITAPEGVALTDPEDHTVRVSAGDGTFGYCREDGDGKLNTCYSIVEKYAASWEYPEDDSFVYLKGHIIPVYWEDLYLNSFDFETNKSNDTLLTEGSWKFDIPLNDWNPRQVELLAEPITAKACIGWKMDGTDVLEDLEVTSIKLCPLGIQLTHEEFDGSPDFFSWTGITSRIVMKDGSHMDFTGGSCFEKPIDLAEVAYIQLADKTIIPMPGVQQETVDAIAETFPLEPQDLPMIEFEGGMELLTDPINMKSLAGYVTDATGDMEPLYEYFTITSAILHPEGLALVGTHAFDFPEEQATVVMKDGSEIILTGMNGAPYCSVRMSQLKAESSIDLSKVDHILLPDGTDLSMP